MTADDGGTGPGVGARSDVGGGAPFSVSSGARSGADSDAPSGVANGARSGIVYLCVPSGDLEAACPAEGGLAAYLSADEVGAAGRFTRAGDRLDYAASHALFRLLAAYRLGLPPADAASLAVARLCSGCGSPEHGKPGVPGVSLSLSRSHGVVMAAAAPAGMPVGADIELVPDTLFKAFDDYVASPGERAGLQHRDVDPRLALWTAKEAVLKAAGLGLAVAPAAVHLAPAGGPLLRADCPDVPQVDGLLATAVPAPKGYKAAVSAGSGFPPVQLALSVVFGSDVFGPGRSPK